MTILVQSPTGRPRVVLMRSLHWGTPRASGWVAGWFQACFQLRPDDDDDDDASAAYGVSFCGEAYGVPLREGDSLGCLFLEGWEPGHRSS